MKEHKYRVWDTEKKEWYEPIYQADKGILHDLYLNLKGALCIRKIDGVQHQSTFENKNRYILMQYIGLKDRNNIEIYENDLIIYYHKGYGGELCESLPYQIIFRNTQFQAKYKNQYEPIKYFDRKNIEIIGNIYENRIIKGG
jgi:uncharacterized phage protein (TIGR01671 family)